MVLASVALNLSAWLFTMALQSGLTSDQKCFTLYLYLVDCLRSEGTAAAAAAAAAAALLSHFSCVQFCATP